MNTEPLVQVTDLRKYYPVRGSHTAVKAVDGVSFSIPKGTALGLVGESGCGKSTTGRLLLRLAGEKTGGKVVFDGLDIYDLRSKELRHLRPRLQPVFQDPYSSLSPRMSVGQLIGEAALCHGIVPKSRLDEHVDAIMEQCGLQPHHKSRYPHEFSGGQRQRIGIARALALHPDFLVCDEPVSALDVSVQAQIITLLQRLQRSNGLTYLFISHDLSVVEHICDAVAVMYLGKIVEQADTETLYREPLHPYTRALFAAIPMPDPDKRLSFAPLQGNMPSPTHVPEGCPFHPRCPHAIRGLCDQMLPLLEEKAPGHLCACHLYPRA